jgi:hypothetical protein
MAPEFVGFSYRRLLQGAHGIIRPLNDLIEALMQSRTHGTIFQTGGRVHEGTRFV